jgi:hypothetical protein
MRGAGKKSFAARDRNIVWVAQISAQRREIAHSARAG